MNFYISLINNYYIFYCRDPCKLTSVRRWDLFALGGLHLFIAAEPQNHAVSVCEGFGESSSKWGMAACVKKHLTLPTKQQQREQQEQQCFTSSFFHYYPCNAMKYEVVPSSRILRNIHSSSGHTYSLTFKKENLYCFWMKSSLLR